MNLVGITIPGERVAAVPGKEVRYRNGSLVVEDVAESGLPDGGAATAPFAKRRRVTGPVLPASVPEAVSPRATLF
jgi:ATP-dependent Lhr-like helicase